ncbi:sterol-binding protein [Ramicandelaber brevisporus]|nr:sterol-binding protein [Ramicandelaber brevisporus]
MSSPVFVDGFKASEFFELMYTLWPTKSAEEQAKFFKQVNAIFQIEVTAGGKKQAWVIDLKTKSEGKPIVSKGTAQEAGKKADLTITVNDDTFVDMATGKLNGQKAFLSGKLKVKGNMMLATKLEPVFKEAQKDIPKSKL